MAARTLHPNLATDRTIRERVTKDLLPLMARTRRERTILRERWLRYYRIWSAEPDQESYRGRVRTYIPVGRRLIENWVTKLKHDLFPSDEWFDVVAAQESQRDRANAVKTLFTYFFTKHARVRRFTSPWLRQLVTFGTSPVFVSWKRESCERPILEEIMEESRATGRVEETTKEFLNYLGPTFRPVDIFAFYAWPVSAMDVSSASLLFEDMLVEGHRIIDLSRTPIAPSHEELGMQFENVDEVMEYRSALQRGMVQGARGDDADKFTAARQRLSDKGFTLRTEGFDPAHVLDITEVFWKTRFRDEDCVDWYRVTLAADRIPLRVQRNPFWHGQPPWLAGKFVEVENEFYGRGLPETFDRMQYFLNDIANQASDALVWSMNPIAIVDPFEVQDPESLRMRPGAKWLAKPDAVRFTEPSKETPSIGFSAVGQILGLMNDSANIAPLAFSPAGRSRGRATQTATGAQIMLGESQLQVRDVVENLEDQVFQPFLRMAHALTMQCMTDTLILKVAGIEGAPLIEKRVSADTIAGDFEFQWLGSLSAVNQQVRAQQMINYLQMTARIPPEVLAQQNAQVDIPYLLRTIWTDGLGLRDGMKVVREITPMKSLDPYIENDLFREGHGADVDVSMADDDATHMQVHAQAITDPRMAMAQMELRKHIRSHQASAMAKQMMQQQREQAMMGAGGMGGGAPGANGGVPAPSNPGRPNQTNSMDELFRSLPRGSAIDGGA